MVKYYFWNSFFFRKGRNSADFIKIGKVKQTRVYVQEPEGKQQEKDYNIATRYANLLISCERDPWQL